MGIDARENRRSMTPMPDTNHRAPITTHGLTLRSTNVRQEHKIAPCYIPGAAWNACRESNALLSASAYSFALSAK